MRDEKLLGKVSCRLLIGLNMAVEQITSDEYFNMIITVNHLKFDGNIY